MGAFVIGVVSQEASVARSQVAGGDPFLVRGACDLPTEVAKLTDGHKAHAVFDGLGTLLADFIQAIKEHG